MDLTTYPLPHGGGAVLVVTGEIDLHTAPQLSQRLSTLAATESTIVVDLTGVAFLDSSALGALVAAHRSMSPAGGHLALAGPQPHVAKVLQLTRLTEVISVFGTVDEAEQASSRRLPATD